MLFKVGDKVTNRNGNIGEVCNIEESSYGFPVVVYFKELGTKTYTNDGLYSATGAYSPNDITTINGTSIELVRKASIVLSKPSPSNHSTDTIGTLGTVITLTNGVQIYQSNTGIPILLPTISIKGV